MLEKKKPEKQFGILYQKQNAKPLILEILLLIFPKDNYFFTNAK